MLKRTQDTCLEALKVIGLRGPWRGPIIMNKRLLCSRLGGWGFRCKMEDGGGCVYLSMCFGVNEWFRYLSMSKILLDGLRRAGLRISLLENGFAFYTLRKDFVACLRLKF